MTQETFEVGDIVLMTNGNIYAKAVILERSGRRVRLRFNEDQPVFTGHVWYDISRLRAIGLRRR